jgi:hypothetical protein
VEDQLQHWMPDQIIERMRCPTCGQSLVVDASDDVAGS